ncbi:hypothetical protein [Falsiroseomonas tokyonensis]|uniref:Uncharacterized protein n=1 Tax=Falsiroseomonas tokyonensis TaxID=430521 RepID=A0ABV7BUI4_9PROT|nr:hypothetical protein [Falsiroseomonas tokyonensis]MBU8538101.1 hypothetical protein [Falsiroseomonas tokyonensis]
MVGPVEDDVQLGLDAIAPMPGGRALALGWVRAPEVQGAALVVQAAGPCPIEHATFHPRPDLAAAQDSPPAHGFALLLAGLPAEGRLVLQAGDRRAEQPLQAEGDLAALLAARPMQAGFALLQDCAASPTLHPLLAQGPRPFGLLADWIARLIPARGKVVEDAPGLEEAETLTSLAGEVMVVVRGSAAFAREALLEAVPLGLLPDATTGRTEAVALPLLDWQAVALPQALIGYGRIDPAWLDRLAVLDLVLQVQPWGEEAHWLRCRPRAATVPDLLDAVCRTTPFAEPSEAAGAAALAQLRLLLARREAAFGPLLTLLAAQRPAPDAGGHLPRLGLILAADDPVAARLFQVTATEFEGRCDRLLVMGDAAEAVAEAFARRGRLPVLVGAEAVQALREAAGRAGVLAVEAPRFAEAVARGRPAEAFSQPLGPADLARLLALHGAAGCEAALSDTLARLLRLQRLRAGEPAFLPVQRGWSSPHAAELVNAHLARLWTSGQAEMAHG